MKFLFVCLSCCFMFLFPVNTFAEIKHCSKYHISFELDLLDWKEVNLLLPKYTVFEVIDIESGKSFHVQRRAGRKHTDVQPLTKKDTHIMKEIYGGKWSWKRRAILVQVNDHLIPGSMHGMPHGAGAIQNNFPGHFCIHFYGSTTHKTDVMDYSHKLMILKSAGELDTYVAKASIIEQIIIFVEAINQHDHHILNLVLTNGWKDNNDLISMITNIETIKIKQLPTLATESVSILMKQIEFEVTFYSKSGGKVNGILHLQLTRDTPLDQWKVNHKFVNFERIDN